MTPDNIAAASGNEKFIRGVTRKEKTRHKADANRGRKLQTENTAKDGINPSKGKNERRMLRLKLRSERLKAEGLKLLEDAEKARVAYENMAARTSQQTDDTNFSDISDVLGSDSYANSTSDASSSPDLEPAPKKKHNEKFKNPEKNSEMEKSSDAQVGETKGVLLGHKDSSHENRKKAMKVREKLKEADGLIVEPDAEEKPPQHNEVKKARKAEKKRKRAAEAETITATPSDETSKEKKRKKSKPKESKTVEAPTGTGYNPVSTNTAQHWDVSGLDGGASRQDKFLRLLGGKKAGNEASSKSTGTKEKTDFAWSADDLQRQFDYGMKVKHEMGGQKRGLGA